MARIILQAVASLSLLLIGCTVRNRDGAGPRHVARRSATPERSIAITILSTNDLHGQLEPLHYFTGESPPRVFRVGGVEALTATIAELRRRDPEGTLLLDAGDAIQGSLLSNRFEGAPVADWMTMVGYDAVVIGNHEFDFGPAGAATSAQGGRDRRGALKAWTARLGFPALVANVTRDTGERIRWPNVHPTTIVDKKGLRIGIIGVISTDTKTTTMPEFVRDLRFAPLAETVRREAQALRSAGAEVVLVLAHAGGSCAARRADSCEGELFDDLLRVLEPGAADAVIAGHTHQCIWLRFNGVPVSEACARGKAVGRIRLVVDRRRRRADPRATRVLPPVVACHDVFSDTGGCEGLARKGAARGRIILNPLITKHRDLVRRARQLLKSYQHRLGNEATRVLAVAARPLRHDYHGPSELGTLIARAVLQAVPGGDIALVNAGALRSDLPAGPITLGELYASFPFDNRVATVRLTGREIGRLIQLMLDKSFGMLQIAGARLRLRCRPNARPKLVAITDLRRRPLVPRRVYTVVLNDFLLAGGGGLGGLLDTVPRERKRVYEDRRVRDEIARYLLSHKKPLNSTERPVVSPDAPPITFEDGPCRRPHRELQICR